MTYRADIEIAAAAHGLDADLVQAVVEQESTYRFYAYRFEPAFFTRYLASKPEYKDRIPAEVSASYGLCQVMFTTAVEHGYDGDPWGLFAPTVSLEYGCRILADNLAWAQGDISQALGAYNAGKGGALSAAGTAYAASVLTRYDRIRKVQP